jgi:hypothetical protein
MKSSWIFPLHHPQFRGEKQKEKRGGTRLKEHAARREYDHLHQQRRSANSAYSGRKGL